MNQSSPSSHHRIQGPARRPHRVRHPHYHHWMRLRSLRALMILGQAMSAKATRRGFRSCTMFPAVRTYSALAVVFYLLGIGSTLPDGGHVHSG